MYEQIKASKQKVDDLAREQNQLKERLNNQEDETRTKLAEKEDQVRKLKNAIEEKEWVEFENISKDRVSKLPKTLPGRGASLCFIYLTNFMYVTTVSTKWVLIDLMFDLK